MSFNENAIVSMMSPWLTVGGLAAVFLISGFSAWKYKNTNDFKKSCILAMLLMTVLAVILLWKNLPLIIVIGFYLCTFVLTSWFSNYFFYRH